MKNPIEYFAEKIAGALYSYLGGDYQEQARLGSVYQARAYRQGDQPALLRVRDGQFDDNLMLNFLSLAVDRSVSMLFGKGITFDLPGEGDTPASAWLSAVMEANKQPIFLHRLGLNGAEGGTCYVRVVPDGIIGRDGKSYPRLVALDPAKMKIETSTADIEYVTAYTMTWYEREGDKTLVRRLRWERSGATWAELTQESDNGKRWITVGSSPWPYDFAPVIHWQNLPCNDSPYGQPDITQDVINLQNRINFVSSNISKIIRLYAHPQRWGKNLGKLERALFGPDDMPNYTNPDAQVNQLEPVGDLESSNQFALMLRQALFDITRSVDISSISDKIGALTNFGLRVLYQDALQKNQTKQELYGDGLLEVVRRLLVIGGYPSDPGQIAWPDPLPQNAVEEQASDQFELTNKLVSRQTVAAERGRDWEQEQERIKAEQDDENNALALALLNRERFEMDRSNGKDQIQ